jgi:hypothetical protein
MAGAEKHATAQHMMVRRNPITGIADCGARGATGRCRAGSVMNWRRFKITSRYHAVRMGPLYLRCRLISFRAAPEPNSRTEGLPAAARIGGKSWIIDIGQVGYRHPILKYLQVRRIVR